MPTISDRLRGYSPLGRVLFMGSVLVAAAAMTLGVFWFLGFSPFGPSVTDTFTPGALDDYLPPETVAVVAFDLQDLRDKGTLDTPPGRALRDGLTAEQTGLPFDLLGVEPARDLDALRLAFAPHDQGRPLVLLRGRFDRARFKLGRGQLEEVRQDGFRLYRHRGPDRDATLALAGDTLVVCLDRARVVAALRHAAGQGGMPLKDGRLKKRLDEVDRKRALWFAADVARLGRPPELPHEAQLLPIFDETEALWGGVAWGKELRAEIVFATRAEANAGRLEAHLQAVAKVAALRLLLPTLEEYEKVILRLFASAEVTRRGTEVTLRSWLRL